MMKRLDGRVAIVTGSSRGIGAAIARRLAADGASVIVNYVSDEASARDVVSRIEAAGGQAFAVREDLTKLSAAEALVEAAVRRHGRLDILVNNAANLHVQPLESIRPEDYAWQMDLNLRTPLFLIQQAARHLPAGGRVINISSRAAQRAVPGAALYSAAKAGLEAFTRVLSQELGPRGITVNTVESGPVETDLLRRLVNEEGLQEMARSAALGRLGRPEDIADVVAFLASEDSRWVSGQTLAADGGMR
jgi:3-oxoacyl-[acyl-carrier protein] reductase